MHEEYKHFGDPVTNCMEECAELIMALCKANRFGWDNYNPHDPGHPTNLQTVKEEISDVKIRIKELEEYINKGK